MVKGAPTAFACTLLQEVDLEGSRTRPLILKIESQYLSDECLKDAEHLYLDCSGLIARIGPNYARMGEKIPVPEIPDE